MSASLLLGKIFIFVAQVVLAWILTKEEIGVLAIIASVMACIKVFHDGGVPQVLVQRGNAEYQRLQGAAFWISLTISLLAGLVLAASAPLIAHFYGDERLVSLLRVLAVTLPLGTPATLLRAKLQIDLRFHLISIMAIGRFAIRSVGMIVLAWLGYGVMCFVIPMLFVAVFEGIFTFLATRATPWFCRPNVRQWPSILRDSYWVVFAAIFKGVARNGDNLVLGLMIPKAVIAPYFFACQWTTQIAGLIALNLRHVLFPIMTKLADQPVRQANAVVRTIRLLILVAAPASVLIAVISRPLETLFLHNKWTEMVPLVQVFALVSPLMILTDISHATITSRGHFRMSAWLTLVEAIWLVGTTWMAVTLADTNITEVAMWVAGLRTAYILLVNALILKTVGISPRRFVASFLPQWILALAVAGAVMAGGRWIPTDTPAMMQIVILAVAYVMAFTLLARLLLSEALGELARVAPGPIGTTMQRVFALPQSEKKRPD